MQSHKVFFVAHLNLKGTYNQPRTYSRTWALMNEPWKMAYIFMTPFFRPAICWVDRAKGCRNKVGGGLGNNTENELLKEIDWDWLGLVRTYFFIFNPTWGNDIFQGGWNQQLDELLKNGLVTFWGPNSLWGFFVSVPKKGSRETLRSWRVWRVSFWSCSETLGATLHLYPPERPRMLAGHH